MIEKLVFPFAETSENGGTPDGKVRVRIRGNNSINSSNEPLYVVDGVIGVSNINLLNPSEIESLEVLKDASARLSMVPVEQMA